jgi:hypothetical protein
MGRLSAHIPSSLPLLLAFALILGCSDDGTGPKKELEPLVGGWKASALVMTNRANPLISLDLVEMGASFTLSVLATGQYSASLTTFGATNTEVGTVTVSGNQVTISPASPEGPPLVAVWSFQGEALVLDGESEFDFNQDGATEPALAHIVLDPIDG